MNFLDKKITEADRNKIAVFDSEGIAEYLDDKFTFISGVVRNETDIIVLGVGRVVNEFKIVVNPKYSKFQIAKAISTLFREANHWAKHGGSNETIVIITKGNKPYIKLLNRHFGFEEIDGTPMKLEEN